MRCRLATFAVVATAALLASSAYGADKICKAASTCMISGSFSLCRRETSECPPCVSEGYLPLSYTCSEMNENRQCPEDSSYCPRTSSSGSGSEAGVPTPEPTPKPTTKTPKPTTAKPTKTPEPTTAEPGSNSGSTAGSGSTTPTPTTKKPKTTKKATLEPTPVPTTATPTPTPTPTPNVTEVEVTSSPSSVQDAGKSTSSNSKMPLILGIAGGSVVVIAVVAFFIWKRRQDDDDDSDDEDNFRFNPPKPTTRAAATTLDGAAGGGGAGGPSSIATTASYNNSASGYPPTSPSRQAGGSTGVGQYGGAKYATTTQYASGNQYQYDQYSAYGGTAAPKYGAGTSNRGATNDRDSLTESLGSSVDDRDVWGSKPIASKTNASTHYQAPHQRDQRALSNVSIEF